MKTFLRFCSCILSFVLAVAASGCGSTASVEPSGSTSVTLLATSTANDQLSQFGLRITELALTGQAGTTVNLFPEPQGTEFIHLNGTTEPLITVSIPQDIYTAATITIESAQFTCVTSGSVSAFASGVFSTKDVTVTLPSPITVTGDTTVLSLNLLTSKSATFTACDPIGIEPYSITPTFYLTSASSLSVANVTAAKPTNIEGIISSVNVVQNRLTLASADGSILPVDFTNNTIFQGISGASALLAGMPVYIDAAIQSGGTLLATRIEIDDTNTTNLSVSSGPLLFVDAAEPAMYFFGRETQGYIYSAFGTPVGSQNFSFENAIFQTSGQAVNLQSLPFPATFTASNMVPGQNVSITFHAVYIQGSFPWVQASTVTLIPQTIDGTVSSVSSQSSFTTYTVTLAPYDLFPNLAVQPGQTTLLNTPGTVVVYADSNTQTLNSGTIGVGSVMRFHGLVFNDNGTLRMDCAQVNDGVAE